MSFIYSQFHNNNNNNNNNNDDDDDDVDNNNNNKFQKLRTTPYLSCEWLHVRVSLTDSQVRTNHMSEGMPMSERINSN